MGGQEKLPAQIPSIADVMLPPGSGDHIDNYFLGHTPIISEALQQVIDKSSHALVSRATYGISPCSFMGSFLDWGVHLQTSPGKQLQLLDKAWRKNVRLASYAARLAFEADTPQPCIEPLPQDRRFSHQAWQVWPFNLISQSFLLQQQWWYNATTGVSGVTKSHERVVEFVTRQMLDMFSPSNFLWTNPEVLERTAIEGGQNLQRGIANYIEDCQQLLSDKKNARPEGFEVGKNLATTPGKVVYRNRLVELIQYAPTTDQVRPEPIFIVPAWIMKYYILDLSDQNSLVQYLTEQGFSVFIVSWKNPDCNDRNLSMQDYQHLGIEQPIEAIKTITHCEQVHSIGYCLGGTLLTIAAATFARDQKDCLKTLTLFAAQTDFTEAGELMLFIDESQVAFLEDMMWERGYMETRQMAGAFQLLRSNDLIWSRLVKEYLMGERSNTNTLKAWNADTTRMPYKMHSQYLRQLFLNNDLAAGRYRVDGRPITVSDIRAPIFVVATERDHVAPWKSVYKIHLLSDTDVSFLLTKGGHNAGIISEPGHNGRHYRLATHKTGDAYLDPDSWYTQHQPQSGSWWPAFVDWLEQHSSTPVAPPSMGATDKGYPPLADAPGSYVLQP